MTARRHGADDKDVVRARDEVRTDDVIRAEEELHVRREERPFGAARLRTEVVERDVDEIVELMADEVEVVEVPVPDPDADSGEIETTADGDMSFPVLAERLVLRKEAYVTKRILLRRTRRPHAREEVHETLRAQRVTVDVDRAPTPEERARERALSGEDLSRGPTPETRHPEGGPDAVRDTTQGPTPEIRRAVRAEEGGGAAAAEPALDRRTRADVAGGQDRRDDEPATDRTVVDPDPPRVIVERPDSPPERSDP
jgi:hypothetical protein